MGEGADRVNGAAPEREAGDIDRLRGELGRLISELDRRRHEALDVRLQLRRHPLAAAVAVSAAALVLGGLVAVAVRRRRRRRSPLHRAREVRGALGRLLDHPDRVAAEARVTDRILAAAGVVVATALTRRLVDRALPSPR
jgi:hypothetical protein